MRYVNAALHLLFCSSQLLYVVGMLICPFICNTIVLSTEDISINYRRVAANSTQENSLLMRGDINSRDEEIVFFMGKGDGSGRFRSTTHLLTFVPSTKKQRETL